LVGRPAVDLCINSMCVCIYIHVCVHVCMHVCMNVSLFVCIVLYLSIYIAPITAVSPHRHFWFNVCLMYVCRPMYRSMYLYCVVELIHSYCNCNLNYADLYTVASLQKVHALPGFFLQDCLLSAQFLNARDYACLRRKSSFKCFLKAGRTLVS